MDMSSDKEGKIYPKSRATIRVLQMSKKITEKRLKWHGHVMRREAKHILEEC